MPGGFQMCSSSFSCSSSGGNVQSYQSHTTSSNMGGQAYSETKQAYSDSSGHQKAGWERHIDNTGHKVVKERQPNRPELTHKTFNNLHPDQEEEFDRQWSSTRQHRLQAPSTHQRGQARLTYPSAPHPSNHNDPAVTFHATPSPDDGSMDPPSSSSFVPPSSFSPSRTTATSPHIEVCADEPSSRGPTTRRRQGERRGRANDRQTVPVQPRRTDRR